MELKVLFRKSQTDQLQIDDFAKSYNINIPENLQKLILTYDGARVMENNFGETYNIRRFLPLNSQKNPSIASIYESYLHDDKINYWFPFAVDVAEWVFCFSIKDDDTKGQIWVDKWNSGDNDSFEFVASTLEEFIDGLRPEE